MSLIWEFILSYAESRKSDFGLWLEGTSFCPLLEVCMGWSFVLGDKHDIGAISFNGIYSCSHDSIGKSAQFSSVRKICLFPISPH